MLHYTEVCLSPLEIPREVSICLYISGCRNSCPHCHYPALRQVDFGDLLAIYYREILSAYAPYATCVCFLGEGENTPITRKEFAYFSGIAHHMRLKTGLYSGRDVSIEPWMHIFDYIKLGSYQEKCGPLSSPSTNQVLYRNLNGIYKNCTHLFWQ